MKPRTLLILALLVAGLISFVWFFERDLPSSDERAVRANRLLRVEEDDVTGLTIEANGKRTRLERMGAPGADGDNTGWRLVEPLDFRADETAVDSLVRRLVALEKERTLEDLDPATAGLGTPRGEVRLTTGSGEHHLQIGDEVPASSTMLARLGDATAVYVISSGIWSDLSKEPGAWRSKDVVPAISGEIRRVTLTRNDVTTVLARRDDEIWLEAPANDLADDGLANDLFGTVAALRVDEFVDEPGEDVGLEPAAAVVLVEIEGGEEPVELRLGAAAGGDDTRVYARVDGQTFLLDADLDEPLSRAPGEWRSRKLTTLEVYRIESAELSDGAGTVVIQRDGGDWRRDGEKIDFGPATDILYAVTGAEAEEVLESVEGAGRGLDLASATLTAELTTRDGDTESLAFYPASDGAVPATIDSRDVILLMSPDVMEDLEAKLQALRDAEPEPEEETPASPEAGADVLEDR